LCGKVGVPVLAKAVVIGQAQHRLPSPQRKHGLGAPSAQRGIKGLAADLTQLLASGRVRNFPARERRLRHCACEGSTARPNPPAEPKQAIHGRTSTGVYGSRTLTALTTASGQKTKSIGFARKISQIFLTKFLEYNVNAKAQTKSKRFAERILKKS